jgi:hypothetical protein
MVDMPVQLAPNVPHAVLPHAVRPDGCRVVQRVLPILGTMESSLMGVAS